MLVLGRIPVPSVQRRSMSGTVTAGRLCDEGTPMPQNDQRLTKGRRAATLGLVLLAAALTGCGPANRAPAVSAGLTCGTGELAAQGSSAQASAMASLIKSYSALCPQASVTYQSTDSRSGQQAFIAGAVDFAGTDSVLTNPDQLRANARCAPGQAIHLPVVFSPIAVAYNLPGIDGLRLSGTTLAKIFAGEVTTWNAPAIRGDNPGVDLPPLVIVPVHRADASGTTQNFTTYLAAVAGADWTFDTDTAWAGPTGAAASGSGALASAIASARGAIGYVALFYAQTAKLATVKIRNAAGEFVPVSNAAAVKTIASMDVGGTLDDFRLRMNYFTTMAGAYPIVQVTYELLCNAATGGDRTLAKSFLTFACGPEAQASLALLGYAPMPADLRLRIQSVLAGLG